MWYKVSSGQFGVVSYVCDTAADMEEVPTKDSAGSCLLCIENSKRYILNGSKEWKEVEFGGSGGGGASLDTIDIYTADYGDKNSFTVNYGAVDPYLRLIFS